MLRSSVLLWLCLVIFVANLYGQNSLPTPTLWCKAQTSDTGAAILLDHEEMVSTWNNSSNEIVNFHSVPVINSFQEESMTRPITTQGGITTFSIYQDAVLEKEQSLWSLSHENTLIATASDARFANNLDNVEYAFAGITNQWLRLSTNFLSHQSLTNANCTYHFGQQPNKKEMHFTGILLEEVVFDRTLSKKQRKQVESYLSVKYGIPLLSNGKLEYLTSTGYAYWSASKNYAFRHRPTALGRDDFWQLYQRQSTNAYEPGLITIGLGTITALNKENSGVLEDQSFLIWSDNNADLEVSSTSSLLDRRWEVQKTTPGQFYTSLRLGVRQLKTELKVGEKYWLAIDRGAEDIFSVETTDYYSPSSNEGREYLHYENIRWDTDESGKDHFTFLQGGEVIVVVDKDLPSCDQGSSGQISFKAYGGAAPYHYQISSLSIQGTAWLGEIETIENIPPGRHMLRVTDANGLQVEQEVEMHQTELQSLVNLDDEYRISQDEILELALPASCDDCSFEWQFPNGEIRNGHSTEISEPGDYQLEISKGVCHDVFEFQVKQYQSPFQSVELWGNPSQNGNFVLEIRLWEEQATFISISNQQGQLVQEISLPLNHYHKYQGQGLETGTYQVQVHANGEFVTKTLITL